MRMRCSGRAACTQAMNETYAVVCSKSYPIAMINFQMNPNRYDVNVTPDKRTVPS